MSEGKTKKHKQFYPIVLTLNLFSVILLLFVSQVHSIGGTTIMLGRLRKLVTPPTFQETVGKARAYIRTELAKMGWRISIDTEMELIYRVQRKFGLTEERVAYIIHDALHEHHH
jgi:hypothetical protein